MTSIVMKFDHMNYIFIIYLVVYSLYALINFVLQI